MSDKEPRPHLDVSPTFALWKVEGTLQQVLRLRWDNLPGPVDLVAAAVDPDGPSGPRVRIEPGEDHWGDALIGVPVPDGLKPGDAYRVALNSIGEHGDIAVEIDCRRPRDDMILFIGAGYHVDPVWWNTQRDYTQVGSRQGKSVNTFLELNRQYLNLLENDPAFACTIETVPALHPTWISEPALRGIIRAMVATGRLELIGSYDQPQSTLVGCELLCRNIAYGIGFSIATTGLLPEGLAQWDVFGHDPVWPALGKAAGLEWTTFCRGLYHGEHLEPEDNLFTSEFRWVSPDSSELLTHYMSTHYTSGWEFSWKSMADGEIPILDRFERLRIVAPTRNLLLPCYGDFAEPFDGMMQLVRAWNRKYVSPKIVVGTQEDYLASVRKACREEDIWLPPISRDLNPAYSGCNLSFADTKIAQRHCERLLRDAEIWATFAHLLGADYPTASLDRAWRILCYTAHHDAVTGSESDQVYLDLSSIWREAFDLANLVAMKSRSAIASLVGSKSAEDSEIVTVFNSLGWTRSDRVMLSGYEPTGRGPFSAVDEYGKENPLIKNGDRWEFEVNDIPPIGCKSYRIAPTVRPQKISASGDAHTIENDALLVRVDPSKGGGIVSILDKASGREFVQNGVVANDIAVYPEYPGMNMAPWVIQPTGEMIVSSAQIAEVSRRVEPGIQSLTCTVELLGCDIERTIILRDHEPFVNCRTRVVGYRNRDRMWRVEFPVDLPGTRPTAQTSGGVIGRPYGRRGDYQDMTCFGDWAVDTWGGLERLLAFIVNGPDGKRSRAVAIGEIVIPDSPDVAVQGAVDRLVPMLARAGVTTVVTRASGRRSGDWLMDGSRPDFRIALGKENAFSEAILHEAARISAEPIESLVSAVDTASACWVDLAGENAGTDLPVILLPRNAEAVAAILDEWERQIASPPAQIDIAGPAIVAEALWSSTDYRPCEAGFAVLVRGTPSMLVIPDGTISLGLFRSASASPSGGWVDGVPVRMPDGSYFQHEHWSHQFEYRLVPHLGDWRHNRVYQLATEFNHPLEAATHKPSGGPLPSSGSFLPIDAENLLVQAIRPLFQPEIYFDHHRRPPPDNSEILVRVREIEGRAARLSTPVVFAHDLREVDLLGRPKPEKDLIELRPWSVSSLALEPATDYGSPLHGISLEDGLRPQTLWPARYWRSSLGPCGWKGQPVFHKFVPSSVSLGPPGTSAISLQVVSNSRRKVEGIHIMLHAPTGIRVEPEAFGPLGLEPDEVRDLSVRLVAVDKSALNPGFLTAVLRNPDGMRTVAAATVNTESGTPLPMRLDVPEAIIVDADRVEFPVTVTNELDREVEGMLELILPYEAWPMLAAGIVRQAVTLAPKSDTTVHFPLSASDAVAPGRYFAVAKWHCLEEQIYSSSAWLIVPGPDGRWGIPEPEEIVRAEYKGPHVRSKRLTAELSVEDGIEVWEKSLASVPLDLSLYKKPGGPSGSTRSLPIRLGHDDKALYVMVEVPWRTPVNPHRNSRIRNADCLHLAFFPGRLAEVGFAFTKRGAESWTFFEVMDSPRPRSPDIRIEREPESTVYLTVIPWRHIHLDSRPTLLPFNVVVHVTGADGRWSGAWALTDRTVFRKTMDGSEFGTIAT